MIFYRNKKSALYGIRSAIKNTTHSIFTLNNKKEKTGPEIVELTNLYEIRRKLRDEMKDLLDIHRLWVRNEEIKKSSKCAVDFSKLP